MKFSAVLGLFAAGVLAAPAEQQQQKRHQAAPFRRPVSGPYNKPKADFSADSVQSPWGGSVQEGNNWMTVTGTTVIPSVTGQSSSAGAAAWVGIDGKFKSFHLPHLPISPHTPLSPTTSMIKANASRQRRLLVPKRHSSNRRRGLG